MINLETNDYVANLIVAIKHNDQFSWYLADSSYWIVNYWDSYCEAGGVDVAEKYFNYMQQFRIPIETIKNEVELLNQKEKIVTIKNHLPSVFIDIDQKKLISMYHEQALEERIPEDWSGLYENFLDLIPAAERYWVVNGTDLSLE